MTDSNTQPVATPAEAAPAAPAEATSAPNTTPDLDSFLSEFETATQPAPAQTVAPAEDDLKTVLAEVRQFKQERAIAKNEGDRNELLKMLNNGLDIDSDIGEEWAEGYLSVQARKNPQLNKVWENRHTNPQAFKKVADFIKKDYQAKAKGRLAKQPDAAATEDRAAVTAAVRGASTTKAPDPREPNYSAMNDAEFQALRQKLGI